MAGLLIGLPRDEAIKRLRAMVDDYFTEIDKGFSELKKRGEPGAFLTMVQATHGLSGFVLEELGMKPKEPRNGLPPVDSRDAPQFALIAALNALLALYWDFDGQGDGDAVYKVM